MTEGLTAPIIEEEKEVSTFEDSVALEEASTATSSTETDVAALNNAFESSDETPADIVAEVDNTSQTVQEVLDKAEGDLEDESTEEEVDPETQALFDRADEILKESETDHHHDHDHGEDCGCDHDHHHDDVSTFLEEVQEIEEEAEKKPFLKRLFGKIKSKFKSWFKR